MYLGGNLHIFHPVTLILWDLLEEGCLAEPVSMHGALAACWAVRKLAESDLVTAVLRGPLRGTGNIASSQSATCDKPSWQEAL